MLNKQKLRFSTFLRLRRRLWCFSINIQWISDSPHEQAFESPGRFWKHRLQGCILGDADSVCQWKPSLYVWYCCFSRHILRTTVVSGGRKRNQAQEQRKTFEETKTPFKKLRTKGRPVLEEIGGLPQVNSRNAAGSYLSARTQLYQAPEIWTAGWPKAGVQQGCPDPTRSWKDGGFLKQGYQWAAHSSALLSSAPPC